MTLLEKFLNPDYRLNENDYEIFYKLLEDERESILETYSKSKMKSPIGSIIDPFLDNVHAYDQEKTFKQFKNQIMDVEKTLNFKFENFKDLTDLINSLYLKNPKRVQYKKYHSLSKTDQQLLWVKLKKCYDKLESEKGLT